MRAESGASCVGLANWVVQAILATALAEVHGGGLEDELLGLVTGESCLVALVLLGHRQLPTSWG